MCNPNTLQQKISELTNDGDVILRFLTETVQAKTPGVKVHHQLEASRQLTRLANLTPSPSTGEGRDGGDTPARTQPANEPADAQAHSTENSEPKTHNSKLNTDNSPVTYLDILNYNLAQLIRSETAEGHTITEFLLETVTGRDSAFTPNKFKIKPDDRMAAAREIINRGFGRRRKLVDDAEEANDYDTLHTDLAKRLRQYSEQGSQAILFLLDVMRNDFPDEQYTRRHRVSAAQELLRRGWDTNYDSIRQEHLLAYWRDQQDARLSVGQKKQLVGLQAYADEYHTYDTTDYNSIAKELRERQDHESEEYEQQRNEDGAAPNNQSLPPRRGKVRMGVPAPAQSPSNENEAIPNHLSRAEPAPSEGRGGNPEGQGEGGINTPSPLRGEGRDGGEILPHLVNPVSPAENSQLTTQDSELNTANSPDCYYEPLSPEDQAIFDYQTLIETDEYKEGEIEVQPPTEAAHQEYEATLKWIRQAAAEEGIPLLPNPLSGTLTHPYIRSP